MKRIALHVHFQNPGEQRDSVYYPLSSPSGSSPKEISLYRIILTYVKSHFSATPRYGSLEQLHRLRSSPNLEAAFAIHFR